MENTNSFVASKLALLEDDFAVTEEQVDRAWDRLRESMPAARSHRNIAWRWLAATASIVAVLALSFPSATVWAQNVWTRMILGRTEHIELDLPFGTPSLLLPNLFPFYPQDRLQKWEVASAAAASALTGFEAKLLTSPSLPEPRIQVVATPAIRRVFNRQEAEIELRKLNRPLPPVPAGLDGAEIVLDPQGKSVWTFYGHCSQLIGPGNACAMLVQARPMVLTLPPAVSHDDYTRFSLELAGVPPDSTRTLTAWSRTQPTLFLPLEAKSEIRRVRIGQDEGTLIVYPRVENETAFVLEWMHSGLSYRLFGRGPENAIALAESLR